jgi:predicted chitinase
MIHFRRSNAALNSNCRTQRPRAIPRVEVLEHRALLSGYSFSRVDAPGFTTTNYGINDSGQIVGEYATPSSDPEGPSSIVHGFLNDRGAYMPLDDPEADNVTVATGINNSGQIVGYYYDDSGDQHGFLKGSGGYSTLDAGGVDTRAYGINDSGKIVGWFDNGSSTQGFVEQGGKYTTLDVLGAGGALPYGINDKGQIVGEDDASGRAQGFLLDSRGFTLFDVPGAAGTEAQGINNSGEIVGVYQDALGHNHGFVKVSGGFITLDVLGTGTWAYGINDSGQVVGNTLDDPAGDFHGLVADPGPVPKSVQPDAAHPGGLVVTYEVFQQLPAGATVPISVYWATGPQASDALSVNAPHGQANGPKDALYTYTVNSSEGPGTYTFDVSPDNLLTAPPAATDLLVVADPTNTFTGQSYAGAVLDVPPHLGDLSGPQLQKLMPGLSAGDAERYAPVLASEMGTYGISSLEQEAMFLGQVAVESNNLRTWIEGPSSATPDYFITHYWVCPPKGQGTGNAPYGTKWAGLGHSYPTSTGLVLAVPATGRANSKQLELHWSNASGKAFATVTFTRQGNLFVYSWAGSNQEPEYTTRLLVVDPLTHPHQTLLTIGNKLGEFRPVDASDFRGRGPIQITGRYNYQQLADGAGLPQIMTNPQLVSDKVNHPKIGIEAATWYFSTHGCNAATDSHEWQPSNFLNHDITGRINARYLNEPERLAQYLRIRALLLDSNF